MAAVNYVDMELGENSYNLFDLNSNLGAWALAPNSDGITASAIRNYYSEGMYVGEDFPNGSGSSSATIRFCRSDGVASGTNLEFVKFVMKAPSLTFDFYNQPSRTSYFVKFKEGAVADDLVGSGNSVVTFENSGKALSTQDGADVLFGGYGAATTTIGAYTGGTRTWNFNTDAGVRVDGIFTVKSGNVVNVKNLFLVIDGTNATTRSIIVDGANAVLNVENYRTNSLSALTATNGAKLNFGIGGSVVFVENGGEVELTATGGSIITIDLKGTEKFNFSSLTFDETSKLIFEDFADGLVKYTGDKASLVETGNVLKSNITGVVGDVEYYLAIDDSGNISLGSAVPEPSTYATIFGVLALGFVAYRRRK